MLAKHLWWGVIALPLLSKLYVRAINVPKLAEKYGWEFRTKLQMAVELVLWFVNQVRALGLKCQIWMAIDGAYASRKVLLPLTKLGVVVFSRLRRDAVLFDLPPEPKPKQQGRPPIYGRNRISLSKRAAHRQGWEAIIYQYRGSEVTRRYKSFLATSRLISGVVRVALVRFEDGGWAAYFCTNPQVEIRDT